MNTIMIEVLEFVVPKPMFNKTSKTNRISTYLKHDYPKVKCLVPSTPEKGE